MTLAFAEKRGIARLAAESPRSDERNEVEYYDLACRSILNPVPKPRREVPFDFSVNPYRGCELGCTYCYARYTHGYLDLGDPLDFERKVYAKVSAGAVLARDLAGLSRAKDPGWIAVGTATDPYQPVESRRRVTREVLEALARASRARPGGLFVSVTTKSDLVLRDADVLSEIGRTGRVRVNVTITTVDRDLARRLEPRAPTPERRLAALAGLARRGVPAGAFAMPVLPAITDGPRDVRALAQATKEAGARWLTAGVLFLMPAAKARFFPWLAEAFPELLPVYRDLYREAYPPPRVVDRIRRLVRAMRGQYGLARDDPGGEEEECDAEAVRAAGGANLAPVERVERQLTLFDLEPRAASVRAAPIALPLAAASGGRRARAVS